LSTTNSIWTDQGSSPGLRGEKPATNRLSHGTAHAYDVGSLYEFGIASLTKLCVTAHHEPETRVFQKAPPKATAFSIHCWIFVPCTQRGEHPSV
jgi:hypothetical protein